MKFNKKQNRLFLSLSRFKFYKCYFWHNSNSSRITYISQTSINIQVGISQVLNDHTVVKAEVFAIVDEGYLTNPHANVVRDYSTTNQRLLTEKRPDKRTAYGVSLKHITMLGEDVSLKNNYRFYTDDWDVTSHTLQSDVYYTLNKKLTLGAGLRYYTQSEANFYNENKDFFTNEEYASSDTEKEKSDATKKHILSCRNHIKELAAKDYDSLP